MGENQSKNTCEWLALQFLPGLGNIVVKSLLGRFGSPREIFRASLSDLRSVEGLRPEIAQKILKKAFTVDPEEELKRVENEGGRIVPYDDPEYPPLLREIHSPPMLLYVKGRPLPANLIFVGMVGSRNPTHYGLKAAEKIAQGLARRGLGVVSGMALGIDTASHWGCLGGRGFTLAVLGTGLDIPYPKSNQKLREQIVEKGALVTEFPLGTPPEPRNFPIRNRVISGVGRGIVVVEATKKSGSLITASFALEQGREVFAVPGSIDSFKSRGCHYLIKQGAGLVETSDDILEAFGFNYDFVPKRDTFQKEVAPFQEEREELIYNMIGEYPIHIDQIARQSGLEPGETSSILMRMELKGMIRQLPGKMFVR